MYILSHFVTFFVDCRAMYLSADFCEFFELCVYIFCLNLELMLHERKYFFFFALVCSCTYLTFYSNQMVLVLVNETFSPLCVLLLGVCGCLVCLLSVSYSNIPLKEAVVDFYYADCKLVVLLCRHIPSSFTYLQLFPLLCLW